MSERMPLENVEDKTEADLRALFVEERAALRRDKRTKATEQKIAESGDSITRPFSEDGMQEYFQSRTRQLKQWEHLIRDFPSKVTKKMGRTILEAAGYEMNQFKHGSTYNEIKMKAEYLGIRASLIVFFDNLLDEEMGKSAQSRQWLDAVVNSFVQVI